MRGRSKRFFSPPCLAGLITKTRKKSFCLVLFISYVVLWTSGVQVNRAFREPVLGRRGQLWTSKTNPLKSFPRGLLLQGKASIHSSLRKRVCGQNESSLVMLDCIFIPNKTWLASSFCLARSHLLRIASIPSVRRLTAPFMFLSAPLAPSSIGLIERTGHSALSFHVNRWGAVQTLNPASDAGQNVWMVSEAG